MDTYDGDRVKGFGFYREDFWLPDSPSDFVLKFPGSDESWKLGPILKEKLLEGDEYDGVEISEASGVCIAEQIDGPRKGMKAIAKVRTQIPLDMYDESDWDYYCDYSALKSRYPSIWAHTEANILKYLTEQGAGCRCTPQYIGHAIRTQAEDDYVPGGYVVYTLMEMVPGTNLLDWYDFDLEKQNRIRRAFGKTIREFSSYNLEHKDPGIFNIVYDDETERCWIIDLEDVEVADSPRKPVSHLDWVNWGLIKEADAAELIYLLGPDENGDPPGNETLHVLAARMETRQCCEE